MKRASRSGDTCCYGMFKHYWRHERRSWCRVWFWLRQLGKPSPVCWRCMAYQQPPPAHNKPACPSGKTLLAAAADDHSLSC